MRWLGRSVDPDDVAVGIEQEKLRETGGTIAADHDMHRIVLRRVFSKAVSSQCSEGAVEIIGAESEMCIGAVDVAGSEGAGRMNGQMHLKGAAAEPSAGILERRALDDREAKQLLIEGERPREIGNDNINVVERKPSHSWAAVNDAVSGAIQQ